MDRITAEENWRSRFHLLGLDERFVFIGRDWSCDHGRKVKIRCRTCGCEFLTWGVFEVLKGHQKHLLCASCGAASDGDSIWNRSELCEESMRYYADGHSVAETAERFGVSRWQINSAVKYRGISNGRDFRQAADESNAKRSADAARRREALKQEREAKRAQRERERQRAIEEERRRQKEEREREKQRVEAEKAEALFHSLNDKIHVCTVCGCSFSIAEFMKSKERKLVPTAPKYCSAECEKKHNHRLAKASKKRSGNFDRGNHRHRARKYGVAYEPGITLKKVWKRDNGICRICGKPCDWSDRSWNKYCGPLYPSVDHIIALANGGGHVWGNVQLAHMMCNSEKGDRLEAI